ncbi:hypothetical protein BJP34_32780 [Moorena producens PAL-8-15-08-1]|uniref:Uncharacterized protein n=1 Tax=Moorena producens PAL-8-15-08-1 TaxID=1458985 RepID=A0A1D8U436_9CYAN|nr:hypothetical protein BJP34_32780 [Moorena producens PAL-8-15-08-1]
MNSNYYTHEVKFLGFREQRAGSREQGAGSSEQGAGSSEQGAGSREQRAGKRQKAKNHVYLIAMRNAKNRI